MPFSFFNFANGFIVAAFLVAMMLIAFKMQWQGFFYMMVVIYAVTTWDQFVFVNFLLLVGIIVPPIVRGVQT